MVATLERASTSAQPRFRLVPPFARSLGSEAVALMASCGQQLDQWQADFLTDAMGVDADGMWTAATCGLNVPRQNGKGAVAEARVLWQARQPHEHILWSSQQQETSTEALYRLVALVDESDVPEFAGAKPVYANGKEAILFTNGSRIRFMTRSKARARGFTGVRFVLFDEAMFLAEYSIAAMRPTLSAQVNPQVWYMGSAVDQQIHDQGVVWARVRERGIEGADRLAYTEFSVDAKTPDDVPPERLADPEEWARANPALDDRIARVNLESEVVELSARSFCVEHLGVGDYPRTDFVSSSPISPEAWASCRDDGSVLQDPIWLGYDLSPERWGAIVACGLNQHGDPHLELVAYRQGMKWIVPRLLELQEEHDVLGVVRVAHGPVASLTGQEEEAGLKPKLLGVVEHGAACGQLVDAVAEKTLRHLGAQELTDAVKGAATRPLGDAWAWARKTSSSDIAPLVAATAAVASAMDEPEGGDFRIY